VDCDANGLMFFSGLKTWIFKWKKNGFLSAKGEAVKNAGIIRCTSIQLNIRASYPQKIRLQHVKGHSGDVGNDGADALANIGTLLPTVEERDWDALEIKLTEQLEKISVETNDVDPAPIDVEDIDDVENTDGEIPSSSDLHEDESRTTMAVTTPSPIKLSPESTPSWTSSGSASNLLPLLSAPQEEKTGLAAASPAQCSALPASVLLQSIFLESPATVSSMDFGTNGDEASSKVTNASICASEVNFDVGLLVFRSSSISYISTGLCRLCIG
jgi:RNase H